MFERFTQSAREVVVGAQQEARALGHCWIGTEHLLIAAVSRPGEAAGTLRRLGITAAALTAALTDQLGDGHDDTTALRDLGIDLEAVRRRVEERFGAGALDPPVGSGRRRPWLLRRRRQHIPFTAEAKRALELALREALSLRDKEIRVEHLVLGLMRSDGLAAGLVTRLGAAPGDVRRAVLDQLGRAA